MHQTEPETHIKQLSLTAANALQALTWHSVQHLLCEHILAEWKFVCVCSVKWKNGFDTEIKRGIVTRYGREREREIFFSGAVRGGDIMEHNWETLCVCVCVRTLTRKQGELVLQSIATAEESVCLGGLSVALNERINTHTHTHRRRCHIQMNRKETYTLDCHTSGNISTHCRVLC